MAKRFTTNTRCKAATCSRPLSRCRQVRRGLSLSRMECSPTRIDSTTGLHLEDVFDRLAKQLRNLEYQRQARIVLLRFDRVDRLPRDAELFGEVRLSPVELPAQIANAVFHSYLRLAMPRP